MPTVTKKAMREAVRGADALRCVAHEIHPDLVGQILPIIKRGTNVFELRVDGQPWRVNIADIAIIDAHTFATEGIRNGEHQRFGTYEIIPKEAR
jgi:hypothetical protein